MPDFTPGPWVIDVWGLGIFSRLGDCSIVDMADANSDKEKFANARLIAAAPDLYEELLYVLGYLYEAHGIATNAQYKREAMNDIKRIEALLKRIDGTEDHE